MKICVVTVTSSYLMVFDIGLVLDSISMVITYIYTLFDVIHHAINLIYILVIFLGMYRIYMYKETLFLSFT